MARTILALALTLLIAGALPAHGQDTAAPAAPDIEQLLDAFPDGMTQEQLDAVLDLANDESIRAALSERLLAEFDAQREAATAGSADRGNFLAFYGSRLRAIPTAWRSLPADLDAAFARPQGIYDRVDPARLVFLSLLVVGVGAIAAVAVAAAFRRRRLDAVENRSTGHLNRLAATGIWVLMDACTIATFFIAALVVYLLLDPTHPLAPVVLDTIFVGALYFLLVERTVNLLSSPASPLAWLAGLTAPAARNFYRAAIVASALLIAITVMANILRTLGLPIQSLIAIVVPVSIVPFVWLGAVVWTNPHPILEGIRHQAVQADRGPAPRLFVPMLATLYLAALWFAVFDGMLRQQSHVGLRALACILIAVMGPLVALTLRRAIARIYAANAGDAGDTDRSTGRIMFAIWIIVAFLIVYVTASLWQIDLQDHFSFGSAAVRLFFNVAIVVLIGFVLWSLIVNAIDRALGRTGTDTDQTRAQRLKTLLPLLRRFVQIVIIVLVSMVALSSLGVEIGPLLAGAGVVGIAIGLGAQQTIADILAGVFFLLEDAFRVGDYVEVGNLRGTVEGISMRSLKLRHHRGAIHTLPFGQMKSLTNYTRDWALMRLEFRVAPDTDVALVKRLVKEISKELAADPEMGPAFIEPLKSQGIRNIEDGAIVIGIKFIAKPGEQFVIRREAYTKILDAFRANGIALVGRGVVVKVESDQPVPPAVAAAAAEGATDPER